MIKERFQEILDFTNSESPYRKANKGWINQDLFLDLSPSPDSFKQKNEAAKITLLWSPIYSLLSNIFLICIISSILVFTSLSFAKGRFDFSLFNTSAIQSIVKVEDNKISNTIQMKALDSINSEIEQKLDINELDKSNKINLLDDNSINSDKGKIPNEIEQQETAIKDIESNNDIQILKNKTSKSNFF